jgi:hypothetical protein
LPPIFGIIFMRDAESYNQCKILQANYFGKRRAKGAKRPKDFFSAAD